MRCRFPPNPRLASLLGLVACAGSEPEIVDWCEVPLAEPAAPVLEPDGRLIYEIYVRSFQDSDGDGVGDLAGVTQRLDHIASLGVGTIWLMPVFKSPSAAGYDPEDLEAVEPDYGTVEDLDILVDEAAARGIRVLYDVAINHTADTHPWFQGALDESNDAETDSRYLFSQHQWDEVRWFPTGDGRYFYAFFGADHPDLNWADPAVAADIRDAMGGWLGRGAGGYRVDAVVQLIEEDGEVANTDGSHCAMAWLFGQLKQEHPDALILSEAWHKAVSGNMIWLGSDLAPEADLVIDVPRRYAMFDALTQGSAEPLSLILDQQIASNQSARFAPYLSSQDVERLASQVEDADARRMWMVFHLLGYGQPILYYGDEIDLPDNRDGGGQDYAWRGPMPWDDTYNAGFSSGVPWFSIDSRYIDGGNVAQQDQDPDSMLSLVRALVALREGSEAVRTGASARLSTDQPATVALLRQAGEEAALVLINVSAAPVEVGLALPADTGAWTDLSSGEPAGDGGASVSLSLEGFGYRVLGTEALAGFTIPAAGSGGS